MGEHRAGLRQRYPYGMSVIVSELWLAQDTRTTGTTTWDGRGSVQQRPKSLCDYINYFP